ncbi:hypothetical protein OC846_005427 [Tilletia horrida]|uniref:Essential protein Yae1 N-terminal domain-containing protein n=1 Tax=Tilletia horrida TaxID=155126 RepID=A0AAN6GLE1_9BASI|nr:hypothetical protein OC846_005427 [Tilletia horrida]KAK0567297.1 hypothetical protein OC861_002801 [Tilletia horrida]
MQQPVSHLSQSPLPNLPPQPKGFSAQQHAIYLNLPSQISGPSTAPPSNSGDASALQSPSAHPAHPHQSSPPLSIPSAPEHHFGMPPPPPSTTFTSNAPQHPSLASGPTYPGPSQPTETRNNMHSFEPEYSAPQHPFGSNSGNVLAAAGPPRTLPNFNNAQGSFPLHPPPFSGPIQEADFPLGSAPGEDIRARIPLDLAAHFSASSLNGPMPGLPASGSLSPRSLLELHQQQLQLQRAMAAQVAAGGSVGGPALPGLSGSADVGKFGGQDFGPHRLAPSGPTGPGQGPPLQRPSSSAGRALAGALAGHGFMGLGHGGPSMGPLSGPPPSIPNGNNGPEEITTVFIVGFPDDMTEREFNNMFLFARGFEASTLKVPPSMGSGNGTGAGGPYNVVNLQGPGTSGLDPAFGGPGDDPYSFGGPNMGGPGAQGLGRGRDLKQMIGFAKFRTRAEALAARDALNGRKIDPERGNVIKTEMAKKNLHTKQRAPAPTNPPPQGSGPAGPSNVNGHLTYGGGLEGDFNSSERVLRQNDLSGGAGFGNLTGPPSAQMGAGPFHNNSEPWPPLRNISPATLASLSQHHSQGLLQQQARTQQEQTGQMPGRNELLHNLSQGRANGHTAEEQSGSRTSPESVGRGEGWPSSRGPLDYLPNDLEASLHESLRSPSPLRGEGPFAPFASNARHAPPGPRPRTNQGAPDASRTAGHHNGGILPPRLNPSHEHHQRSGGQPVTGGYDDLRSPMSPDQFAAFPAGQRSLGYPGPLGPGQRNTSPPQNEGLQTAAGLGNLNRGILSPPAALDMDALTSLEDSAYQRGYAGGHDHGKLHGTFEGRQLGREKGYEIWDEVGYYEGVAQFWQTALDQAANDPNTNSRRLGRQRLQLGELQRFINAFPQVNRSAEEDGGASGSLRNQATNTDGSARVDDPLKDPSALDITTLIEHIRARFKITASLLGIPPKFAQQQQQTVLENSAAANTTSTNTQPNGVNAGGNPSRSHQLANGQIIDTQQLGF